jgi:hypothetical protein
VKDLINNPDYLAYKFNFRTENVEFMPVSRQEMRRVSSLSREFIDSNRQLVPVPLAQLAPMLKTQAPPAEAPRFIYHTAFCSSTFLSRCLDVEGVTVVLREPQILLDAANAKRLQWRSQTTGLDYRHMPQLALALLNKHALPGEKLVIKPINSVNNLLPEIRKVTGPGKSLMLYTDARNFLFSTLKKGEEAKNTVRAMFDLTRCDFPHLANLRISDAIHMTDLKVILTLWRLQIEQAEQALRNESTGTEMASLYGERIIENPVHTLRAANRFLDLGISEEQIDAVASSDLLAADAKNAGQEFSANKRKDAYRKVSECYGDELDKALHWMTHNNSGTRLVPQLSRALPDH